MMLFFNHFWPGTLFGAHVCVLTTDSSTTTDAELPSGTWRHGWFAPWSFGLQYRHHLFRCWQCLCLFLVFRFLRSHHQDCTVMTCHVLYNTSSLLSPRGKTPYLVMFQYAREEACLYFSALIRRRSRVCCLQHKALNQRICCLKNWRWLMDVKVRADQSQKE